MTPKNKAQELISEYRFLLSLPGAPLGDNKDNVAKQCALNTVTNIIQELGEMPIHLHDDRHDYWTKVQKEIEIW